MKSAIEDGVVCVALSWITHTFATLGQLSLHADRLKSVWPHLVAIKR